MNFLISVQSQGFQVIGLQTFSQTITSFCFSVLQDSGIRFAILYFASKYGTTLCSAHNLFANSSISHSNNLSALNLSFVFLSSINGSLNHPTCPDATQVCGFIRIAASSITISVLCWTNVLSQAFLIFSLSALPYGP